MKDVEEGQTVNVVVPRVGGRGLKYDRGIATVISFMSSPA